MVSAADELGSLSNIEPDLLRLFSSVEGVTHSVILVLKPAIVAGDGVGEEVVVFTSAAADVVDDEWGAVGIFLVGDDHDVGAIAGDGAGDKVAGEVFAFVFGDFEGNAASLEVGAEVGDAAVVDVFVRASEAPDSGVF